jgi:MFS family permease
MQPAKANSVPQPKATNFSFLLGTFVYLFARGLIIPVLPLYLESLRFSVVDIGLAFASLGAGTLVFEPVFGVIADIATKKKSVMHVLAVLTSVCYLSFPYATTLPLIVALAFFYGGFTAGMAVFLRLMIVGMTGPDKIGRSFGLLGSMFSGSAVVGSVAGGALAAAFGFIPPFYAATIVSVVSIFPLNVAISKTMRFAGDDITFTKQNSTNKWKLELSKFFFLGVLAMTIFVGQAVYTSLMPVVVTRPPLLGTVIDASIMIAIFNLSVMVFQPIVGSIGARRPRLWIIFGLGLSTAVFLLLPESTNLVSLFLLTATEGLAFSMVSPLSLSLFTNLAPPARKGTAIGIYGAAEDIGIIIGPVVFSVLWAGVSLTAAFIGIATMSWVVFLYYLVATRAKN